METLLTRRLALTYFGFGALSWSRPADETFPNWTNAFVDKMLTESAWAQSSTVGFQLRDERRLLSSSFLQIGLPRLPLGGVRSSEATGVRTEIFLTTRWASALPMRQAMALSQFGRAGLDSPRALELLNRNVPEYVIEVAGFPVTIIRQGAERFEAELAKTARLTTSLRSTAVAPVSVQVPPHGMHLMATLRFPRVEGLSPSDGWIELTAESGPLKIRNRFKLKDMVYSGRLEL